MFGIDDYYSGLIEEAKSPEEIKKILEYQFVQSKGVPQEILDKVFEIDPTKKKSYTRWVLTQWDSAKKEIVEALKDGKLERLFKTFKERASDRENGGLDLTNIESFQRAMEYVPDVDPCLTKEGDPNSPENQFDIVYDTPEWTIAVPHTYQADKKLGQGCRWCTAGAYGDHDGYWKNYSAYGPLWVNFDRRKHEITPKDNKEYPYTRYQFLFEYQNYHGELMDSDDHRVDFDEVNMPEEVVEFYGEQNPRYKEVIENGGVDEAQLLENYNEARWDAARMVLNVGDNSYLSLLPEENNELRLDVDYMLYDENDISDPIDYTVFDPNDFLIARMPNEHAALLKDIRGNYHAVYYTTGQRWRHFEITPIDDFFEDNGLYILTHNANLYVMPCSDEYCDSDEETFAETSLENFDIDIRAAFINRQIAEIANEQGIEGYYGACFEVVYGDGGHGLFLYNGYDIISMIEKDYPVNEEKYVATEENGQICIKGRMFTHKFNEGGEKDEGNLSFVEDLGEFGGIDYYLVISSDGNKKNVFDATNNKLLFDKGLYNITNCDNLLVCYELNDHYIFGDQHYKFLYDLETRRVVIPSSLEIGKIQPRRQDTEKYWFSRDKDGYSIYFAEQGFKKISGFQSVLSDGAFIGSDGKSYVPVRIDENTLNLFNLSDYKMCFPNIGPSRRYGTQGDLFVVERENGLFDFFCCTTGEMICQNVRATTLIGGGSRARTIKYDNGKYNIISFNGEFYLPHDVDLIRSIPTNWNEIGYWVSITDKRRFWFLDISKMNMLPTKDGIDLTMFGNVFDVTRGIGVTYKGATIFITLKEGGNMVDVRPQSDEDVNIATEVKALIYKEATQIRENFNKTLNMINNFYKDKD